MERHIDTGHGDVGALAAGEFTATLDFFLQRLKTTDRARDRVLRTAKIEVDDLQKFASAGGDLGDERRDIGIIEIDLRRSDGSQTVVGASLIVTRHDVVHLAAAVEHHFEQSLEFVHAGDTGQCRVLADRVPTGDSALDEGALFAHLGYLGGRHGSHGYLSELRQVQHAVGMLIVHARSDQARRIVADDVQHRETEGRAGELVGPVPDLARGLGSSPHLHAHALVLNTLARERIGRLGCSKPGGRRHDELTPDFSRDLQNLCAQVDSDPVHAEVDLIARLHHAQETSGPPHQLSGRDGTSIGGRHHVLGRGRQPHAVHDRSVKTGQ